MLRTQVSVWPSRSSQTGEDRHSLALCCQDWDRGKQKFWAEGPGAKAKDCLGELGLMQEGTFVLGFEEWVGVFLLLWSWCLAVSDPALGKGVPWSSLSGSSGPCCPVHFISFQSTILCPVHSGAMHGKLKGSHFKPKGGAPRTASKFASPCLSTDLSQGQELPVRCGRAKREKGGLLMRVGWGGGHAMP